MSTELTPSTDVLGSAAFKPVKSDILGNVKVHILQDSEEQGL